MEANKNYYIKVHLENYQDNDLDVRIYKKYHDDIGTLIDLFNEEHTWDKMYTVQDCYTRFDEGLFCILWYWENNPFGLRWVYPMNESAYILNTFVSKKRPNGKTILFYYKFYYLLKTLGYHSAVSYVDHWNIKSKKLFDKLKDVEHITKDEFDKLTESVKKYTYI